MKNIFKRNKPIENIMDADDSGDWHDLDYWNKDAFTSVDYEGMSPTIDDNQLNWLFPKGSTKEKTSTMSQNTTKRYYQIFQKIKMAQVIMMSQFDWKGLPEDIDELKLEEKITYNGSIALIKLAGKYYLVNYTIKETNVDDEPIKIAVNEPDVKNLNEKEFTEFVIIYNDSTKMGLYQLLAPEVNPLIETKIMLARNPKDTKPQGFFPTTQNNVKTVSQMVSALRDSKSPYHTIIVDDSKSMFNTDGSASKTSLVRDNKGNLFIDGTLPNNAPELLLVAQYWENEFKKALGLNISGGRTNERTIQAQLGTEQSIPKAILETRLKYRKNACKKINKLYNLNISVEKVNLDDETVEKLTDTQQSKQGADNNEN